MVGHARPPKSSEVVSLFGIAADQQHLLALLRHHVGEVGEREALTDAAFAVDRDDLGFLGRLRRYGIRLDRGFGAKAASAAARSASVRKSCATLMSSLSSPEPSSGRGVVEGGSIGARSISASWLMGDQAVERERPDSIRAQTRGEIGRLPFRGDADAAPRA